MKSRLKTLQDRDAAITAEMRELSNTLAGENRLSFNDSETEKFNTLKTESEQVKQALAVERDLVAQELQLASVADVNADTDSEAADRHGDKPKVTYPRYGKLKYFKSEEAAYRSGQFFLAVMGSEPAKQWCKEHGVQTLAQSSSTNSAGGVLVPDELSTVIIDLRETYGVFRQEARILPMGSDVMIVPRRTGGLTAAFVSENTDTTESEKAWDSVTLVAKELAAMVRYPNSLAEDAIIALAEDLAQEIAYAFAKKEDECGFIGDATSTYGGITGAAVKVNDGTHTASVVTAATGHTGFETFTLSDFHALTGKLPLFARPNAKFYVSAPGYANCMERLMYAAGGNSVQTIGGKSVLTFLGYPVVLSQVLNSTLGADVSKIKVLYGDLRQAATMGDRRGVTIESSGHRYFEKRQVAIQGSERFDINVHDLGDNTNAGPLVALKSAAS